MGQHPSRGIIHENPVASHEVAAHIRGESHVGLDKGESEKEGGKQDYEEELGRWRGFRDYHDCHLDSKEIATERASSWISTKGDILLM